MKVIEILCTDSAAKNLEEILTVFKIMGQEGSTRQIKVSGLARYLEFDGDGPDKIKSINVKNCGVKNEKKKI